VQARSVVVTSGRNCGCGTVGRQPVAEDVLRSAAASPVEITGDLLGIPPTQKTLGLTIMDFVRYNDAALMEEHWAVQDVFGALQQARVSREITWQVPELSTGGFSGCHQFGAGGDLGDLGVHAGRLELAVTPRT